MNQILSPEDRLFDGVRSAKKIPYVLVAILYSFVIYVACSGLGSIFHKTLSRRLFGHKEEITQSAWPFFGEIPGL